MRCAGIAAAVIIAIIGGAAPGLAQEGLVAHYTFDEGAGETARDLSGSGNDGRIAGATYVESPRGHALQFDGVDDYVDCGSDPSLNLSGDLTLEVWLRADETDGRNRMIFGDAAGLTINRNFNLRLDRRSLRFEYADGTSYGVMLGSEGVLDDGEWHHLALICETPRYYLYLDGRRTETGDLVMPITPTQGAPRRIAGWFAGHFQGAIDEIRLYKVALPERVVLGHFRGERPQAPFKVELDPRIYYSAGTILVGVLGTGVTEQGCEVEVMLGSDRRAAPYQAAVEPLRQTRPSSERWRADLRLATEGLEPGPYHLHATVRDESGARVVASGRTEITYPERPVWLGSDAGKSDEVLAPYTPLVVERATGAILVSPWGRTYVFGPAPVAAQVTSRGAPLLTGPVRFTGQAGGSELSWQGDPPSVVEEGPSSVRLQQSLIGDRTELDLEYQVDYDGLMMARCVLRARRALSLRGLALEIPIEPEHARYLYTWPQVHSGALEADYASAFQPIVWLGDEERGLAWLCESDENWLLSDLGTAIQVLKAEAEVTLRLTLVDAPARLAPGDELSYTFALQATPLKPITRDAWDYRIVRSQWYGHSLTLADREVDGKPALQHYADRGARALIIWRWWDVFAYPAPLGHEDEFRAMVEAYHRHGIKVVPYVGGFLLSDLAPEAAYFRDEMAKLPLTPFPLKMPGLPTQLGHIVCQRSPWQDFLVDGIARLIDDYDVDGVYLDTTTRPYACTNQLHGCGYRRPDGTFAPTYPVFSVRDNLRRIYTVVKQRKPDGIVDVHVYDCMNPAALAYATTYWNGEQLPSSPAFKPDVLPLDRFRTEFMGHNWGVPADLLYYKLGDYDRCCAIALLHDVPIRAENLRDLDTQAALWDLRERFGCRDARWLPYWDNADYVSVSPPDCHVSLYHHPDNGVLAYVANLRKEDCSVEVELDAAGLGLSLPLSVRDALSEEAIPVEGARMSLPLPSQGWRAIWVNPPDE